LMSGTGHYDATCCDTPTTDSNLVPVADPTRPGEPWWPGGLLVCVAEGCRAQTLLNFVYFMYQLDGNGQTASLVFDPTRSQSLLYSQSAGYYGDPAFHIEHNFHVAPVPLPASFLLLLPALGMLARFNACRPSAGRNPLA